MSILHKIQAAISQQFPSISSEVVSIHDSNYLRLWKNSTTGLKYLPNFNLIIEFNDVKDKFDLKIITFHGKDVDHRSIDIKSESCLNLSLLKFVQLFDDQASWICLGGYPNENSSEYFNNELIARSPTCLFRIDANDKSQVCSQCSFQDVKDESIDFDNFPLKQELVEQEDDTDFIEASFDDFEAEELDDLEGDEDFVVKNEPEVKPHRKKPGPKPKKEKKPVQVDENGEVIKKKRGRPPKPGKIPKIPKRKNNKQKFRSLEDEKQKDEDEAKGFKTNCQVCLRTFASRVTHKECLTRHRLYFKTEGLVQCPLCQEEVEKLSLTLHFKESHSPLTCCLVCLKTYPNQGQQLKLHIRKEHQLRPMCWLCNKSFYDDHTLDVHNHSVHDRVTKSTCCHRCGRPFTHEFYLHRHLQRSCGTEDWTCDLCSKIFDTRYKMEKHLKVHCQEKPYICLQCAYSCYKMENMVIHSRKVHHLRGNKQDCFINQESLKRQKEFVAFHIEKTKPVVAIEKPAQDEPEDKKVLL